MQSVTSLPSSTRRVLLAAALAIGALVLPQASGGSVTAQAEGDLVIATDTQTGSASAYAPINPIRVLDTRGLGDGERFAVLLGKGQRGGQEIGEAHPRTGGPLARVPVVRIDADDVDGFVPGVPLVGNRTTEGTI